jgi:hypothetical protein
MNVVQRTRIFTKLIEKLGASLPDAQKSSQFYVKFRKGSFIYRLAGSDVVRDKFIKWENLETAVSFQQVMYQSQDGFFTIKDVQHIFGHDNLIIGYEFLIGYHDYVHDRYFEKATVVGLEKRFMIFSCSLLGKVAIKYGMAGGIARGISFSMLVCSLKTAKEVENKFKKQHKNVLEELPKIDWARVKTSSLKDILDCIDYQYEPDHNVIVIPENHERNS